MLTRVLEDIISAQVKRKSVFNQDLFPEVRIMDSTEFVVSKNLSDAFPGYGGTGREAIAQVQLEYELLGGKVTEMSLGSSLDSDAFAGMKNIDQIPPKTLLIRDLGYSSPKAFKQISQHELYFVSRAKAQWSMYEKRDGKLINITVEDIKSRLMKTKEEYLDMEIFVGNQVRTPVRLIANFLSKEQTQKRIKKKKAKGIPVSKLAKESAGLNLFVTNVEKEKCSAKQIYELYTLRWQIELIFKTWKSILKIHKIHPMNALRLECVMLIKFIWVMLNWSLLKLIEDVGKTEISYHKLSRTLMSQSKSLNLTTLQSPPLLLKWLHNLFKISMKHHLKEYKKGTKSIATILQKHRTIMSNKCIFTVHKPATKVAFNNHGK